MASESGRRESGIPPATPPPKSPSTSHGSPHFVENEILNAERCGDSVSYIKLIWTKANEQELVQKKTFTKWVNAHLALHKTADQMSDLFEDIRDGTRLCYLLEVLSGKKLAVNKGSRLKRVHHISNITTALQFLSDRNVRLVNINPSDIADGKPPIVLGLIWTIILHFQIEANLHLLNDLSLSVASDSLEGESGGLETTPTTAKRPKLTSSTPKSTAAGKEHFKGGAKKVLLSWVKQQITEQYEVDVKDFTVSWRDGRTFAVLLHSARPDLIDLGEIQQLTVVDRLHKVFNIAEKHLGVPRILDPDDVNVDKPDEKSLMTYVAALSRRLGSEVVILEPEVVVPKAEGPTEAECLLVWINEYVTHLTCSVNRTQKEISLFYQRLVTLRVELSLMRSKYLELQSCPIKRSGNAHIETVWLEVVSKWEILMSCLTMKCGDTTAIDSLPPPLNRIVLWLERSEYLLESSEESRVLQINSLETLQLLTAEVQEHWDYYMRVNSEFLSIFSTLCDSMVTGDVMNDMAPRLKRYSKGFPIICLRLAYYCTRLRFYSYESRVKTILRQLNTPVSCVGDLENSIDVIESSAEESEPEAQQLVTEAQLAGSRYADAEPTARLRVEEDLQNLDRSSRGLLTEIRQFHQLRISLLLSLRRFDELYKHLSAQITACLSGEITTASPLQEMLNQKNDLFKHYDDIISTSAQLAPLNEHTVMEEVKLRKAQVESAWTDLEKKEEKNSTELEEMLLQFEHRLSDLNCWCSFLTKNKDNPIGEQMEGFKDLLEGVENLATDVDRLRQNSNLTANLDDSDDDLHERLNLVSSDCLSLTSKAKDSLQRLEESFTQMQRLKEFLEDYSSRIQLLQTTVETTRLIPSDELDAVMRKLATITSADTLQHLTDIESVLGSVEVLSLKLPPHMNASEDLADMRSQLTQMRKSVSDQQRFLSEVQTVWTQLNNIVTSYSRLEEVPLHNGVTANQIPEGSSNDLDQKRLHYSNLDGHLKFLTEELGSLEQLEASVSTFGLERLNEEIRLRRCELATLRRDVIQRKDQIVAEIHNYESIATEVTELLRWMSEIREELTSCADASGSLDTVQSRLKRTEELIERLSTGHSRREHLVKRLIDEGITAEDPVAISNHWSSLMEVAEETQIFLRAAISQSEEMSRFAITHAETEPSACETSVDQTDANEVGMDSHVEIVVDDVNISPPSDQAEVEVNIVSAAEDQQKLDQTVDWEAEQLKPEVSVGRIEEQTESAIDAVKVIETITTEPSTPVSEVQSASTDQVPMNKTVEISFSRVGETQPDGFAQVETERTGLIEGGEGKATTEGLLDCQTEEISTQSASGEHIEVTPEAKNDPIEPAVQIQITAEVGDASSSEADQMLPETSFITTEQTEIEETVEVVPPSTDQEKIRPATDEVEIGSTTSTGVISVPVSSETNSDDSSALVSLVFDEVELLQTAETYVIEAEKVDKPYEVAEAAQVEIVSVQPEDVWPETEVHQTPGRLADSTFGLEAAESSQLEYVSTPREEVCKMIEATPDAFEVTATSIDQTESELVDHTVFEQKEFGQSAAVVLSQAEQVGVEPVIDAVVTSDGDEVRFSQTSAEDLGIAASQTSALQLLPVDLSASSAFGEEAVPKVEEEAITIDLENTGTAELSMAIGEAETSLRLSDYVQVDQMIEVEVSQTTDVMLASKEELRTNDTAQPPVVEAAAVEHDQAVEEVTAAANDNVQSGQTVEDTLSPSDELSLEQTAETQILDATETAATEEFVQSAESSIAGGQMTDSDQLSAGVELHLPDDLIADQSNLVIVVVESSDIQLDQPAEAQSLASEEVEEKSTDVVFEAAEESKEVIEVFQLAEVEEAILTASEIVTSSSVESKAAEMMKIIPTTPKVQPLGVDSNVTTISCPTGSKVEVTADSECICAPNEDFVAENTLPPDYHDGLVSQAAVVEELIVTQWDIIAELIAQRAKEVEFLCHDIEFKREYAIGWHPSDTLATSTEILEPQRRLVQMDIFKNHLVETVAHLQQRGEELPPTTFAVELQQIFHEVMSSIGGWTMSTFEMVSATETLLGSDVESYLVEEIQTLRDEVRILLNLSERIEATAIVLPLKDLEEKLEETDHSLTTPFMSDDEMAGWSAHKQRWIEFRGVLHGIRHSFTAVAQKRSKGNDVTDDVKEIELEVPRGDKLMNEINESFAVLLSICSCPTSHVSLDDVALRNEWVTLKREIAEFVNEAVLAAADKDRTAQFSAELQRLIAQAEDLLICDVSIFACHDDVLKITEELQTSKLCIDNAILAAAAASVEPEILSRANETIANLCQRLSQLQVTRQTWVEIEQRVARVENRISQLHGESVAAVSGMVPTTTESLQGFCHLFDQLMQQLLLVSDDISWAKEAAMAAGMKVDAETIGLRISQMDDQWRVAIGLVESNLSTMKNLLSDVMQVDADLTGIEIWLKETELFTVELRGKSPDSVETASEWLSRVRGKVEEMEEKNVQRQAAFETLAHLQLVQSTMADCLDVRQKRTQQRWDSVEMELRQSGELLRGFVNQQASAAGTAEFSLQQLESLRVWLVAELEKLTSIPSGIFVSEDLLVTHQRTIRRLQDELGEKKSLLLALCQTPSVCANSAEWTERHADVRNMAKELGEQIEAELLRCQDLNELRLEADSFISQVFLSLAETVDLHQLIVKTEHFGEDDVKLKLTQLEGVERSLGDKLTTFNDNLAAYRSFVQPEKLVAVEEEAEQLQKAIDATKSTLETIIAGWPFFKTRRDHLIASLQQVGCLLQMDFSDSLDALKCHVESLKKSKLDLEAEDVEELRELATNLRSDTQVAEVDNTHSSLEKHLIALEKRICRCKSLLEDWVEFDNMHRNIEDFVNQKLSEWNSIRIGSAAPDQVEVQQLCETLVAYESHFSVLEGLRKTLCAQLSETRGTVIEANLLQLRNKFDGLKSDLTRFTDSLIQTCSLGREFDQKLSDHAEFLQKTTESLDRIVQMAKEESDVDQLSGDVKVLNFDLEQRYQQLNQLRDVALTSQKFTEAQLRRYLEIEQTYAGLRTRLQDCSTTFSAKVSSERQVVRSCGDWVEKLAELENSVSNSQPIVLVDSFIYTELASVKGVISKMISLQSDFDRFFLEGRKAEPTGVKGDAQKISLGIKSHWQSIIRRAKDRRAELQFCLDHLTLIQANNQILESTLMNIGCGKSSASLKSEIIRLQNQLGEMAGHHHVIALTDLSLDKMKPYADSRSFDDLFSTCVKLKSQWNTTVVTLEQRMNSLTDSRVELSDLFNKLRQLHEWMDGVRGAIEQRVSNSQRKLTASFHFLMGLLNERSVHEAWVKETVARLAQLESKKRHQEHQKLQEKFERTQQRLEVLRTRLAQRLASMRSRLNKYESFRHDSDATLADIQRVSAQFGSATPSVTDSILHEVDRLQPNLDAVVRVGESLRDATDSKSEKKSLELKLKIINESWDTLRSLRDAAHIRAESIDKTFADLKKNVRKLRRWARSFKHAVAGDIIFQNARRTEMERQLLLQEELERDLAEHESPLAAVLNFRQLMLNDKVMSSPPHTHTCSKLLQMCDDIRGEVATFPQLLLVRRDFLNQTFSMWNSYECLSSDFLRSVTAITLEPNSAASLFSISSVKQEQMKFEQQYHRLTSLQTELNEILLLLSRLASEGRQDAVGDLWLLARNCSSALEARLFYSMAILRRLQHSHQLSSDWERELNLLAAQVELAKCQAKKPGGETTRNFEELLSVFEQSMEVLRKRCCYLIQRSEPKDAAKFDNDFCCLRGQIEFLKAEFQQQFSKPQGPVPQSQMEVCEVLGGAHIVEKDNNLVGEPETLIEQLGQLVSSMEETVSCPTPEGFSSAMSQLPIERCGQQLLLCEELLTTLDDTKTKTGAVGLDVTVIESARQRVSAVKKLVVGKRERLLVNQKLYQEWVDTVKITRDWLFSETIPSVYISDDVVKEEVGSLEELHQLIEQHKSFMQNLDSMKGRVQFVRRYCHFVKDSVPAEQSFYLWSREVLSRWDIVCSKAQTRQHFLQRLLIDCPEFKSSLCHIFDWLHDMEQHLREFEPILLHENNATVALKYKRLGDLDNEIQSVLLQLASLQSAFESTVEVTGLPTVSDSSVAQINGALMAAESMRDLCQLYRRVLGLKLNGSSNEQICREVGLPEGSASALSLADLHHEDTEQFGTVSASLQRPKSSPVPSVPLPAETNISKAAGNGGGPVAGEPSVRGRLQLRRVLLAALPLQALMVLLLGAASLMPHCDSDYGCFLSNNFASSFYPILSFPGSIPPPH